MRLIHEIRRILWKAGLDVTPFNLSDIAKKRKLLKNYKIDVVFDVGANVGKFGRVMRSDIGFGGQIVSFEPLSAAFGQLKKLSDKDPKWEAINCALGEVEATAEINIASNSVSSSLLDMLPTHLNAAPEAGYIAREQIEVKTLDSAVSQNCSKQNNIFLKIDTQGYESQVIAGAKHSLPQIKIIQLEMSLRPLYQGDMLFGEMHNLLMEQGYSLAAMESGFTNVETGEVLQVDGTYVRL